MHAPLRAGHEEPLGTLTRALSDHTPSISESKSPGWLWRKMKIAWIGIWRMWQHLSCYIGNGFTSNWYTEKKRERTSKFHGSHGQALVPKQPMNLDVMARHAQTACAQICHTVIHEWQGVPVVFFVTCFWLSNFVALPSRDTIGGLFSRNAAKWPTTARTNTEEVNYFGRFVRAMREFSMYISRFGVGNVPGIFIFLAWYHHHDLKNLGF